MVGIIIVKQKYFRIGRKPISRSFWYRVTVRIFGKKAAQRLTYEDY